jgi:L-fucose mutarotase
MLRNVDPLISAELLYVMMLMGHGDDIVICDVNHPAAAIAKETTCGKLIDLSGCAIPQATKAILSMMPLDTFVDEPVMRMRVVGDPGGTVPIFKEMQDTLNRCEDARSRSALMIASISTKRPRKPSPLSERRTPVPTDASSSAKG